MLNSKLKVTQSSFLKNPALDKENVQQSINEKDVQKFDALKTNNAELERSKQDKQDLSKEVNVRVTPKYNESNNFMKIEVITINASDINLHFADSKQQLAIYNPTGGTVYISRGGKTASSTSFDFKVGANAHSVLPPFLFTDLSIHIDTFSANSAGKTLLFVYAECQPLLSVVSSAIV